MSLRLDVLKWQEPEQHEESISVEEGAGLESKSPLYLQHSAQSQSHAHLKPQQDRKQFPNDWKNDDTGPMFKYYFELYILEKRND